ncbi:MAG: hypothetical protein P8Z75_15275 [Gammaproteobacteria bacterium]
MLFNGFARPLRLKRNRSRLLAAYLVIAHVLAFVALSQPLAIGAVWQVLLYLAWLCSAILNWRYYRHQHDDHGQYWIWQTSGDWLRTGEARLYSLNLSRSLQTPWFVTVTLSAAGIKNQRLLIFRDQLDADTFRRLRVRLKLAHDVTATRRADPV